MARGTNPTKGLRPKDSLGRARQLYPNLGRSIANEYGAGEGWQVCSTATKSGWLDICRYNYGDRRDFLAVRALTVKKAQGFAQDSCGPRARASARAVSADVGDRERFY